MSKTKNGPIVRDSTEVRVLSVQEGTVVDELRTDDDILTCLIGRTRQLYDIHYLFKSGDGDGQAYIWC